MFHRRILIVDDLGVPISSLFNGLDLAIDDRPGLTEQVFLELLPDYEGLVLRSRFRLSAEVLARAKKLRFIARLGAGVEHIDVAYCQTKGIEVISTPEGNADAVGEHALGMLLSLCHHLHRAHADVQKGLWQRLSFLGDELMNQCVGILGYGNTGRALARRLKSLQTRIIAYDKYVPKWNNPWAESVSLDALFEQTQILSIHIPLTTENKHFINAIFLKKFKRLHTLINTSRGGVLDTRALWERLRMGHLKRVGLDVWEEEGELKRMSASMRRIWEPLKAHPGVLLTPHIAGMSKGAFERMAAILVSKIKNFYHISPYE